jgi:pyruvate-formate lyase-activating enzyme
MPTSRFPNTHASYLAAVVANARGEIFDLEGYAAIGRADQKLVPLTIEKTQAVAHGAELMYLPDRRPVVFNLRTGRTQTLSEHPYQPHEPVYPVAVFNSPGYVNCYLSAYHEMRRAGPLPLFSYGAAGWHAGRFHSAVVQVDPEPRQDLRLMNMKDVQAGIERKRRQLPANRLARHLERCATVYGCPAGKNFFLERYEAPLPTARSCNARCLGCLSLQTGSSIPHSQDRIDFTPTPEEIAEVALHHIQRVENSIVSFGQGCEGDPLLAADVIISAIGMIRSVTAAGTINVNTNGSLPGVLDRLFDAGLDSVRISLNSVRKDHYCAYFRPCGYHFEDVLASIELAVARGRFVSINYLNCAGFNDSEKEAAALIDFIDHYGLHMIQWRNLNYDPVAYWKKMADAGPSGRPLGMCNLLDRVRKAFPELLCGYFNPPKERFGRSSG